VTESSGNDFADLGLEDPEEAMAKAEIARAVSVLITAKNLTQSQAATLGEACRNEGVTSPSLPSSQQMAQVI
jgi:predicted XRE-type DNA-binding protein